jgi:hypothetical protein
MRTIMIIGLVIFALSSTLANAASGIKIIELSPGSNGKILARDAFDNQPVALEPADFPAVPFTALEYDEDSDLVKVKIDKGTFWLTPATAKVSREAKVMTDCEAALKVTQANRPARPRPSSNNRQEGLSRGLGDCN